MEGAGKGSGLRAGGHTAVALFCGTYLAFVTGISHQIPSTCSGFGNELIRTNAGKELIRQVLQFGPEFSNQRCRGS